MDALPFSKVDAPLVYAAARWRLRTQPVQIGGSTHETGESGRPPEVACAGMTSKKDAQAMAARDPTAVAFAIPSRLV